MAIQNVIISLVLRGHNLGSQLLREDIRKGIPAEKSYEFTELQENEGGKANDSPCHSSLHLRWVLHQMAEWNLLFFSAEDEAP